MRTRNQNYGRSGRVIHGEVSPRRASSALVTVSDGVTEFDDIAELEFVGGSIEELVDGVARITVGGGGEDGETAGGAITQMLNASGDVLVTGAVVVVTDTDDRAVTTGTAVASTTPVGVVMEPIPADEIGPVLFFGYAAEVVTTGTVVRGDYLQTSATAGAAKAVATRGEGTFGVVLSGAGITDFAEVVEISEEADAVTSLAITVPVAPVARTLFLALFRDPAVTSDPTLTGWTRIGSTSGFWYYRRVSTGADTASASWTTASPAAAIVMLLHENVSVGDPVETQAFDSTNSAAAVSGMSAAPRYAIAAVHHSTDVPAGWDELAATSVLTFGGGAAEDLNRTATITVDTGRHTGDSVNWNDMAKAADGNDATYAFVNGGTLAYSDYIKSDLGSAQEVSAFGIYASEGHEQLTDYQYSLDGSTGWTSITGVTTGDPDTAPGATFTFDAPITSRYWAIKASATGPHTSPRLNTWKILGKSDVTVVGRLVGKYIGRDAAVTSPFSGAGEANDAIFALNLNVDSLVSALITGFPDLGGGGSGDVATDAIWDAKGDLAVGTGANTAAKRTVGANGTVLTADSAETTGVKWATPGAGAGIIDFDRVALTSGNITVNSTTWTNLSTSLDLTLTAASGDICEVTISALAENTSANFLFMECATWVAGAGVTWFGSGELTTTTGNGVPGWHLPNVAQYEPISGSVARALVSGDISSGTVTLRIRTRVAAGSRVIRAESATPLIVTVKIWRP